MTSMLIRNALVCAGLILSAGGALAQVPSAMQGNPLQPRVARPQPAAPAQAPAAAAAAAAAGAAAAAAPAQADTAKPRRQRSAAQLANDDRMRKCGAEWRANKAALGAQGKTWRAFNVECRARLKAARQ
jgi:hypothetical protein